MCTRPILLGCSALIGVSLLFPVSAHAESTDAEKIQLLERQTEMLQKQLKEIKDELTRTRRKTDQIEAKTKSEPIEAQTNSTNVANTVSGTVSAEVPVAPRAVAKAKPPIPEGVKVTLGGFLAAETVWRQRNTVNDIGTNFNAIPYPFSPLFNENEFHGTARQSRISLLAEGNIDPYQKLSGFFEMDFRGTGTSSNYVQSNSWVPRLRQAFAEYDNTGTGFHMLAGQAWSMLTQNTVGITPRKENIPLTIDANYVVGFNYTRNMQVRFWEQFNPIVAAGVSVESPQFIFGGSQTTIPNGLGLVGGGAFASGGFVNGLQVNFLNAGAGDLTGVNVTTDQLPDVIEKVALDPGWGHYEFFAVQRFFTDNILNCAPFACNAAPGTINGSASTKTSFGEGIGGSVLVPVIPKYLDFTANVMYGQGIGRYGAANLPDVTIASDGSLTPLLEFTTMLGLVGHPWDGLDVYAYAGYEQVHASYFNSGNFNFGFGNPGFSNVGCYIVTTATFAAGAPATNCIANNRRVGDITGGFWQNLYKGEYGRLAVGAQYEYIKRNSFNGIGGAVSTDDNIVMTSIRYYPFN